MDQALDLLLTVLPQFGLPGVIAAAVLAALLLARRMGWISLPSLKKKPWPPKDFWDDMANRN